MNLFGATIANCQVEGRGLPLEDLGLCSTTWAQNWFTIDTSTDWCFRVRCARFKKCKAGNTRDGNPRHVPPAY